MDAAKRYLPWVSAGLVALMFLYMGLAKILLFDPNVTDELFARIAQWLGMGYIRAGGPVMVGIIELTAAVLLLTRRAQPMGALIAFLVLTGALFLHLLGPVGLVIEGSQEIWNAEAKKLEKIEYGDGGSIFVMAVIGWIFAASLLWLRKDEIDLGTASSA